jgi:hypothetical protein
VDKKIEVSERNRDVKAAPAELCCPLTGTLMDNAVTADDGIDYDAFAIRALFDLQRTASPPAAIAAGRARFYSPVTGAVITTRLRSSDSVNRAIADLLGDVDMYATTS